MIDLKTIRMKEGYIIVKGNDDSKIKSRWLREVIMYYMRLQEMISMNYIKLEKIQYQQAFFLFKLLICF